jgi:tRNA threonylcarbamoyladenosine modification (KEOPS) complex  Pcc1 subunit
MVLQERTDIEVTEEKLDEAIYPVVVLSRTAPVKTQEISFTLTKNCVCIVLDGKAVDVSWDDFDRLVDAVRAQRSSAQDD